MKYKLSKELVYKIMKQEIINTGIKVEVLPLTKLENLYLTIKEDKQKNKKVHPFQIIKKIIKKTDNLGDFNFENNHLKIFLDDLKKDSKTKEIYLIELLTTTYHEYNHKITWEQATDIPNLRNFILLIEQLIIETTELYNAHHDDFYEEIIANIYGIEKSEQFLKRYPNIFEKLKGYIENDKLNYQINLINYDIEQFINYFSKILQESKEKSSFFKEEYPYNIVGCLYDKDGAFKRITTLMEDKNWNFLEKEVQYSIVASKSYLRSQQLDHLSKEELTFILEAVDYSYQQEINRSIQNQELRIRIQRFNREIKPTLDYIVDLMPILNKKEKRFLFKIKYLEGLHQKIKKQLTSNMKAKSKILSPISNVSYNKTSHEFTS